MLQPFNRCYPCYGVQPAYGIMIGQQQQQQNYNKNTETRKAIDHYSYALNEEIGRGFSSKVYKGRDENTQQLVAVKVIDMKMVKQSIHSQLLKNEINALKTLNSKNILKLFDVFQTQNNTYIITEFCDSGDLNNLIKKKGKIEEAEVIRIISEVCHGLREMNKKGFIHRDIKPANILVDNNVPKIADFGFAINSSDISAQSKHYNVGTPLYMSPQSLRQQGNNEKGDVWAIGVMFYEMLFGRPPFTAQSEAGLLSNIMHQGLQIPAYPAISDQAKDFIRRCLQIDEKRRFRIKEMISHPIILNDGVEEIERVPLQNLAKEKRSQSQGMREYHSRPIRSDLEQNVQQRKNMLTKQNSNNIFNKENQNVVRQNKRSPTDLQHQHMNPQGHRKSKEEDSDNEPVVRSRSQKHLMDNRQPLKSVENKQPNVPQSIHAPIKYKVNNDVLFSQINFCRFLFKFSQTLLSKSCNLKLSQGLKEKLLFLIAKNIQIKIKKLAMINDKENYKENLFNLDELENYKTSESFQKFSQAISEYNEKYSKHFEKVFILGQKSGIVSDKKFEALFDRDFNEFESFYFITQSYIRQALQELKQEMIQTLESSPEVNTLIPQDFQQTYYTIESLTSYLQLIQFVLDASNDYKKFQKLAHVEQMVDRKPQKHSYHELEDLKKTVQQLLTF